MAEIDAKGIETWANPCIFWAGNVKTNIIIEKPKETEIRPQRFLTLRILMWMIIKRMLHILP
ncbi:MAG: hypothetical protein PHW73_10930 [Atribacterota bacterium]|nr:hypothetical protein [Atribacterota bacterium]